MSHIDEARGYRPGVAWNEPRARTPKTYEPDPSCQPCPDCGGLECLCRPRFFAGQLLSEQDLNRLDRYIMAKNRLRARYLFGSGVVCGLEVRCNPCGDLVQVMPGYALSPCGDDIVVCKQDFVDICALIDRCRATDLPDCRPYGAEPVCKDLVEDWILAIRYEEKPSRGITPLVGAPSCSCGGCGKTGCGCGKPSCSCGGASAGCCGEVETAKPAAGTKRPRRDAPPACEPTLTCEGYRYEVFRAPKPKSRDDQRGLSVWAVLAAKFAGTVLEATFCCLDELFAGIEPPPTPLGQPIPANRKNDWYQWCCRMRQFLVTHVARHGGHDCETVRRLQSTPCADPAMPDAAFNAAMTQSVTLYGATLFEAAGACFCSAALPHCADAGDPRVPLAAVRVRRGGGCTIVSVCNWTPLRHHVLTFPTLSYWFGWLPPFDALRQWIHTLCCEQVEVPPPPPPPPPGRFGVAAGVAQPPPPPNVQPQPQPQAQPMWAPYGLALKRALQEQTMPLGSAEFTQALFATAETAPPTTRDAAALAASPHLRVLAELVRPLAGTLPQNLLAGAPAEEAADHDSLQGQIKTLRHMLEEQQQAIAALKRKRNK